MLLASTHHWKLGVVIMPTLSSLTLDFQRTQTIRIFNLSVIIMRLGLFEHGYIIAVHNMLFSSETTLCNRNSDFKPSHDQRRCRQADDAGLVHFLWILSVSHKKWHALISDRDQDAIYPRNIGGKSWPPFHMLNRCRVNSVHASLSIV